MKGNIGARVIPSLWSEMCLLSCGLHVSLLFNTRFLWSTNSLNIYLLTKIEEKDAEL